MKPLSRPCLDCGALTTNPTRCDGHQRAARQPTHPAYSDPEYRRNRKLLLTEHVARFGWTCPGAPDLDHDPHPATDLTADHIVAVTEGGGNGLANLRVLCQPANTAKGGSNRRRADR